MTVRPGFNLKFKLASAAPVRAGHGVAAARPSDPETRPTVAATVAGPPGLLRLSRPGRAASAAASCPSPSRRRQCVSGRAVADRRGRVAGGGAGGQLATIEWTDRAGRSGSTNFPDCAHAAARAWPKRYIDSCENDYWS